MKSSIFTPDRVQNYIAANAHFPKARWREFESFRRILAEGNNRKALELGSGSGVLTRLVEDFGWCVDSIDDAFEREAENRRHFRQSLSDGLPPALEAEEYQVLFSLACLYHVVARPDALPRALAEGIARVTARGGLLIFQDVPAPAAIKRREKEAAAASAGFTAGFFRDIVDQYSEPAHDCIYLELDAVGRQLQPLGFDLVESGFLACDWEFSSTDEMTSFIGQLFSLNLPAEDLFAWLEPHIRKDERDFRLPWALDLLVMQKRQD